MNTPVDRGEGGVLIVNADDWGRDPRTTDMILDCANLGAVSATSAMVFMEDSERAAAIALDRGINRGLHLNLTESFSAPGHHHRLVERQRMLAGYLRRHRFAPVVFHPGLANAFEYVVATQIDEYRRLYGADPDRLDGHHHMHLCANVLLRGLLPVGTSVRRSFSFHAGEKSVWNRLYRRFVDGVLQRRHRVTDYFFSLAPLEPAGRLDRVFTLARSFAIELETHPVNQDEYRFLSGGEIFRRMGDGQIASPFRPLPAQTSGRRRKPLNGVEAAR
jgi:hypothetical protein